MGHTTAAAVWNRINSLVAGEEFGGGRVYRRSDDPFSFEYVPRQGLDGVFYVEMAREAADGLYLGGDRREVHGLTIWLGRKWARFGNRNASHTTVDQLKFDLDQLETKLYGEGLDYAPGTTEVIDFDVTDGTVSREVAEAGDPESLYVVGRLGANLDFDRARPGRDGVPIRVALKEGVEAEGQVVAPTFVAADFRKSSSVMLITTPLIPGDGVERWLAFAVPAAGELQFLGPVGGSNQAGSFERQGGDGSVVRIGGEGYQVWRSRRGLRSAFASAVRFVVRTT